jgi:hypothetical protein
VRALAALVLGLTLGCGRSGVRSGGATPDPGLVSAPSATAAGGARPGMIWIPPGVFHAGTRVSKVPRVAEEELPGTEVALGGYYIDALPFPDEAGAIATTNVVREDAAKMCEAKARVQGPRGLHLRGR